MPLPRDCAYLPPDHPCPSEQTTVGPNRLPNQFSTRPAPTVPHLGNQQQKAAGAAADAGGAGPSGGISIVARELPQTSEGQTDPAKVYTNDTTYGGRGDDYPWRF